MYVCMYVCMYMYVRMYVCMYVFASNCNFVQLTPIKPCREQKGLQPIFFTGEGRGGGGVWGMPIILG